MKGESNVTTARGSCEVVRKQPDKRLVNECALKKRSASSAAGAMNSISKTHASRALVRREMLALPKTLNESSTARRPHIVIKTPTSGGRVTWESIGPYCAPYPPPGSFNRSLSLLTTPQSSKGVAASLTTTGTTLGYLSGTDDCLSGTAQYPSGTEDNSGGIEDNPREIASHQMMQSLSLKSTTKQTRQISIWQRANKNPTVCYAPKYRNLSRLAAPIGCEIQKDDAPTMAVLWSDHSIYSNFGREQSFVNSSHTTTGTTATKHSQN